MADGVRFAQICCARPRYKRWTARLRRANLQAQQNRPFLAAMLNRRMLICVMTGLASGMPLYLLIQLVPAWLRAAEVSLAEIGLFALVVGDLRRDQRGGLRHPLLREPDDVP